ncbi:Ig-like domain-containing protein [Flavobacterium litorale]|uniref:Ig-like domain-containing protein n=1 Tax=Flavobacterium litorale TaxID=2856519 RepID=A0ABX8V7Y2_9FLAO|nr:Ig-like domain-containing protein [Flavobacterium litorale]QYJ68847.1 Ig-like domain-containing protein [Flavobacterium litorale]
MPKNSLLLYAFFITMVVTVCTSCAKRGSITGGAKDTIPPSIVRSSPRNMSTEFRGNEIRIDFDEYVKIKNANKQLIISPPMETAPIITPTGSASKYIRIKIRDTLQPNTTYSFNFGQSITDNNEGNPYSQFRFVFSTGTYIDSLRLDGRIKDAQSQKADDFVTVMLYEDNETYNDSTVFNERPRYVTNTLDSMVVFSLQNLKKGKYHLFALKDENNNYRYDPKSDKIGFLPYTITVPNDTIYELELFKEQLPFEAKRPKQASSNRLYAGFAGTPKAEDIKITVADAATNEPIKTITTVLKDKDSVQVWLPRNITTDSLKVNMAYRDSINDFTMRFKEMKAADSLSVNALQTGTLHFREKFTLKTTTPLTAIDSTKISLIQKDSANVPFTYAYDDFKQELKFDFEKEEEQQYTFTLLPGALRDFYDTENDTLTYRLKTTLLSDYGNLRVKLTNADRFPLLLQITNAKEEVQAAYYSEGETEINFDGILPTQYLLRVIYDDNKNGKWDTGNYLQKIQPEQIIYFTKPIDVRANWDVNQVFNLAE